jgi:hypothetical protein
MNRVLKPIYIALTLGLNKDKNLMETEAANGELEPV